MKKAIAEFVGTFALVFLGCSAIVTASMGAGPTAIDILGIAFAFGLSVVAMAYGIGPVSGAHLNPAVSFGFFMAGRMPIDQMLRYWVGQVLGALVAATALYIILSGKASGWTGGLGQTTFGGPAGYSAGAAFVFEAVATFLFLVVILGVTQKGAPSTLAGLAIGLALVAVHLAGINVSGASVNPARSIGPALVGMGANGGAVSELWLYIIAPLVGAGVAGTLFRSGTLEADSLDVQSTRDEVPLAPVRRV